MARGVQLRTDVADNHFPVLIHNPGGVALHARETAKEKEKGKNHLPALCGLPTRSEAYSHL